MPPSQTVSMAVGPDVPYSSSSPTKSSPSLQGNRTVQNVIKSPGDNARSNGAPASASGSAGSGQSQLITTDKDAFPAPTFAKVPSPSNSNTKSIAAGVNDNSPKEVIIF